MSMEHSGEITVMHLSEEITVTGVLRQFNSRITETHEQFFTYPRVKNFPKSPRLYNPQPNGYESSSALDHP
jgi:hypothetical protein